MDEWISDGWMDGWMDKWREGVRKGQDHWLYCIFHWGPEKV